VIVRKSGKNIWKDDALELFIDPGGDGLFWDNPGDFQIGVRAEEETGATRVWSWFQGGEDPSESGAVHARSVVDGTGYILEGRIRWDYLGINPKEGLEIRLSPALHDLDRDRSEMKAEWHFRNEEDYQRFGLGRLRLEGPGRVGKKSINGV